MTDDSIARHRGVRVSGSLLGAAQAALLGIAAGLALIGHWVYAAVLITSSAGVSAIAGIDRKRKATYLERVSLTLRNHDEALWDVAKDFADCVNSRNAKATSYAATNRLEGVRPSVAQQAIDAISGQADLSSDEDEWFEARLSELRVIHRCELLLRGSEKRVASDGTAEILELIEGFKSCTHQRRTRLVEVHENAANSVSEIRPPRSMEVVHGQLVGSIRELGRIDDTLTEVEFFEKRIRDRKNVIEAVGLINREAMAIELVVGKRV